MTSWLLDPWQHAFMQHAFIAIILIGMICGAIGVFVILRGLAFLGDALAHAIFPGVVIAFILGGSYLIGALIAAIIVSLGIGAISQSGRIKNDTAVGVLFVGAFALGVALMSLQSGYVRDLNTFLFGSILGVGRSDLVLTAAVGVLVLALLLLFRRELIAISFDRTFAKANGLNLWKYDQIFLAMLALAIVISIQTVGNILVLAMLVTPAATARLLTNDLRRMIVISGFIGAIAGVVGLYISYYQGVPSGAAVVLTATVVFGLVFLFAPRTGAIATRVRRRLHHPHPEQDTFATTP
ncbi:MAG TPA: metal ABC transporter permease [Thermomicrobiales bacterium]|jgi:manganese/iron transport system permease protein|nr:metal ABC transporter permease [Thermomicrobiales bacterium]